MNYLLSMVFIGFTALAFAGEKSLTEDIDCDGEIDLIQLKMGTGEFEVSVKSSLSKSESKLSFGLGQSSRQDAICGTSPELLVDSASSEDRHVNMFGSTIPGYKYDETCKEITVSDGMCDPIYIFYDHKQGAIGWLRL